MKSNLIAIFSYLFFIALLSSTQSAPLPSDPEPPRRNTRSGGASSVSNNHPSTSSQPRINAAPPLKPQHDLKTYISDSLKGTGLTPFEQASNLNDPEEYKATPEAIHRFDTELNEYIINQYIGETSAQTRRIKQRKSRVEEIGVTGFISRLSARLHAGFIDHCGNESVTGADLICAIHIEQQLPGGSVRKIFGMMQVKVIEEFETKTPVVDFTYETDGLLQMERLAVQIKEKRAALDPSVDVVGFYGIIHRNGFTSLPLDDILQKFKGRLVDMTTEFSRTATLELMKKYHRTGLIQGILDYVESRESSGHPRPSTPHVGPSTEQPLSQDETVLSSMMGSLSLTHGNQNTPGGSHTVETSQGVGGESSASASGSRPNKLRKTRGKGRR
ncbi:hypothetical protein FRC17_006115 [Serendipita sp. 399]|nr:hypothetical protein FRC17_006115 [Serendipita sp. 399]